MIEQKILVIFILSLILVFKWTKSILIKIWNNTEAHPLKQDLLFIATVLMACVAVWLLYILSQAISATL